MLGFVDRTCFAAALALVALPTSAAVAFKQQSTVQGTDGTHHELTEVIVDGDNVRMNFIESDNPMMGSGTYMLKTADATFLVNPATRSYMRMDKAELEAMQQQANQMTAQQQQHMQQQGVDAKPQLSGFEFKTLVDEPGPTLLGMPTRHYKFHLSYKVSRPMASGINSDTTMDRTEEFWSTAAVPMPKGSGPMLAAGGSTASDASLPEVANAEQTMSSKGLKLKANLETTRSGGLGGSMSTMMAISSFGMSARKTSHTSKRTDEVLEVRPGATVPAGTFDLPKGYAETSMMGPASSMPNLNQMPGAPPSSSGMPDLNHMPPNSGMPDLNQLPPH